MFRFRGRKFFTVGVTTVVDGTTTAVLDVGDSTDVTAVLVANDFCVG